MTQHDLKFEQAVIDSFHFLETAHGFRRTRRVDADGISLRYEIAALYMELTYLRPEYMPAMQFGRSGVDAFTADDLLLMDCCADFQRSYTEPDRLTGAIAEFARLLTQCGSAFLAGDLQFLDDVKRKRDARANEREHADARRLIERAWSAKDYRRVIDLYESMSGELTELDRKRLQFAKKQM